MNKYLLIDDKRLSESNQSSARKKISDLQTFTAPRTSFDDRSVPSQLTTESSAITNLMLNTAQNSNSNQNVLQETFEKQRKHLMN